MAIHEMVLLDDHLREMITKKHADSTYRQYVEQHGFNGMFYDGLYKGFTRTYNIRGIYRVIV